ncbi:GNAT family N-acetyltransferase [Billgrantia endophytica]|uniref:GNAT family N-acetyltransferase n=1 Tax=Billgrantia endophytica TaxID=2033802 RepID=A0A2N7U0P3_9GAMM|nr:GNAT family N-acetyltransferase [Halomonas endophytica]PMR73983.1 GNAT family N-acetyltransferase [Halomonas endophytica]
MVDYFFMRVPHAGNSIMKLELKEVTLVNFEEVIALEVTEDQRGYVAGNLYSIAESKFHSTYRPCAIYCDNKAVGFLMYESLERHNKPKEYSIFRFMIDKEYQGKGLGRKAMDLILAEIREKGGVEKISICYVKSNPVASGFYGSFGFREIGIDEETGEVIAEIRV